MTQNPNKPIKPPHTPYKPSDPLTRGVTRVHPSYPSTAHYVNPTGLYSAYVTQQDAEVSR